MTDSTETPKEFDSKLLPILREAVEVVRMILFKELKEYFVAVCPEQTDDAGRLAAGVLNDLFGVINPDPAYAGFVERNQAILDQAVAEFPSRFEKLLIPLSIPCGCSFSAIPARGLMRAPSFSPAPGSGGCCWTIARCRCPIIIWSLIRRLGAAYGLVLPPLLPLPDCFFKLPAQPPALLQARQ